MEIPVRPFQYRDPSEQNWWRFRSDRFSTETRPNRTGGDSGQTVSVPRPVRTELVEIPVRPFQYRDPSELATESNRQHVFHSGPSTSTRTTTNSPKTLRPYPNPTTTVLLAIRTLSSGRTRNRTSACLSPHVTRTNLLLAPSYWPTPTPYLTYRHTTSLSELY